MPYGASKCLVKLIRSNGPLCLCVLFHNQNKKCVTLKDWTLYTYTLSAVLSSHSVAVVSTYTRPRTITCQTKVWLKSFSSSQYVSFTFIFWAGVVQPMESSVSTSSFLWNAAAAPLHYRLSKHLDEDNDLHQIRDPLQPHSLFLNHLPFCFYKLQRHDGPPLCPRLPRPRLFMSNPAKCHYLQWNSTLRQSPWKRLGRPVVYSQIFCFLCFFN